tara:strand:- start:1215 stop:1622 length:408 start_codon:yes stop_codon:yes gene_type:complete
MKNPREIKLQKFTQKISKDIAETYIEKYNKMLSGDFKDALINGCIETDMDHQQLCEAIHNLADIITDSQSFGEHCLLASHFINDNDLEDGQIWNHLGIEEEEKDLPFVCYHITVHLLFQLLEKRWVIGLLPNALD